MKSIPEQLEAKLESKISFNTNVVKLDNKNVFLENETLSADVIVLAANHDSAKKLIPSIDAAKDLLQRLHNIENDFGRNRNSKTAS